MNRKMLSQRYYYNRGARNLPALQIGDRVIFKKNGKEWNYGCIIGVANDRSYIIRDNFDKHFRRNRRFIAKSFNNEIEGGAFLFDDNIVAQQNKTVINDNAIYNEIRIMPSCNNNRDTAASHMDEPEIPVANETNLSSEESTAAGTDDSEVLMSDQETTVDGSSLESSNYYRTRSGRESRPVRKMNL